MFKDTQWTVELHGWTKFSILAVENRGKQRFYEQARASDQQTGASIQ
jgi:hypothetical protein